MQLVREITIERSAAHARSAARTYLLRLGYRSRAGTSDQYERGSLLGSFISFSPRGWRCLATVRVRPAGPDRSSVRLGLEVNTSGQMVTAPERDYWEAEADGFHAAITTGETRATELSATAEAIESGGKGWLNEQVVSTVAGALVTIAFAVVLAKCGF